eukprot:746977-Hanusia_phi.AAC.5
MPPAGRAAPCAASAGSDGGVTDRTVHCRGQAGLSLADGHVCRTVRVTGSRIGAAPASASGGPDGHGVSRRRGSESGSDRRARPGKDSD